MKILIHWVFIVAATLSKLHEVDSEDENNIEILFVNDMQYGFYPLDQKGIVCSDADSGECKGGLARIVKALEISYPPPTTTTESTTQTTPTATESMTQTTENSSSITSETGNLGKNEKSLEKSYSWEGKTQNTCNSSTNICFPNNTLFLNAGNYLHSSTNNWFDLLKYEPAITALNSLRFSAVAIGPDVLQYGEKKGMDFASRVDVLAANVQKSSNEDLPKSKTFFISGVNVTVIGFLGKSDEEKYYGGIKISDAKKAIEAEIKNPGKNQIYIAIGAADVELAKEIAKIPGMNIVIYSGSTVTEDVVLEKITNSSWIATSKPPAGLEPHGLIGRLLIQLNESIGISEVKISKIEYKDEKKATDGDIKTFELTGYLELKKNMVLLGKTPVALGGNESCSALEYGLGDLVTDAMRRFMAVNYEDGIAMWNLRSYPPTIDANKNLTIEDIYTLLGKGNDEIMYVVPLSTKQLVSLLEESIDNLDKKDCSALQISGLYVDYESWESKGKRIKRIRLLTGEGLKELDLKENRELKVIVPSHLMKKLNVSSSSMDIAELGTSVAQVLVNHIGHLKLTNSHFYLPPLGFRYADSIKPCPKIVKCHDNAGEAVVLTLAVIVMIGALGLFTWYIIIPRIRQRRGSTIPLIY